MECRVCGVSGFDPAVKETLQITWNVAKMRKWKAFLSSFCIPPLPKQKFFWKNSTESYKVLADTFYVHFLKGEIKIHLKRKETPKDVRKAWIKWS